jgi:hypothetical protein
MELYLTMGPKWSEMAAMFEGRRSCEMKYRWHAVLKRGQQEKINRMRMRLEMRESAMGYPDRERSVSGTSATICNGCCEIESEVLN